MGKIIAVTGLEGAGKSTFAVNLSLALASKQKVVILVAAQLNYGTIQLHFGEEIGTDKGIFASFTDRTDQPEKFLVQCRINDNLYLFGVPNETYEPYVSSVEDTVLTNIFRKLSVASDFLIVDGTSGLHNPVTILALDRAQTVFDISTVSSKACLRIQAIKDTFKSLCSDETRWIVSTQTPGCDMEKFLTACKIKPAAYLPEVPHAWSLESMARQIYTDKNRKSRKYKKVIDDIARELIIY